MQDHLDTDLSFRRQFILGPHFVPELSTWKRLCVAETWCLTIHPDLDAHQLTYKGKSITLLGFLLDPDNPESRDFDILDILVGELDACESSEHFIQHTYALGGRWILIVHDGKRTRLFHDTAGLRQVCYTDPALVHDRWCASQPGLIARTLNLYVDLDAAEFVRTQARIDPQYWFPGDSSLYKEIRRLLPNHYLDLDNGSHHRYWPDRDLDTLSLAEAVERTSRTLQGLVESAHSRFDLAMALTSGWDSRVLLAATKRFKDSIWYFTAIYWKLTEDSPDVDIPARLLPKLGLEHHLIKCPPDMDTEFRAIYKENVPAAHDVYGSIAQGLHNHYPQDRVCVKGNVSEVARQAYELEAHSMDRKAIDAHQLAKLELTDMDGSPFAVQALERWLDGASEIHNIHILDLFYWEQRMGSWQSMAQLEWDIVQEVFCPYNCRSLLIDLLSVDVAYRDPHQPKLYHEIAARLWPEVLSEPVNPASHKTAFVPRFLRGLAHKKILGRWWWWMWMAMNLSRLPNLGSFFAGLAGLPLGPYKGKQPLARVTSRPYISPRAQICASEVQIGPQCFIDDYVTIAGQDSGSITLDERVHVYRGTVIEASRGAQIDIGQDTHIGVNCVLNGLVGDVRIGRDVYIAPYCGLFSGQHEHDDRKQKHTERCVSRGDIAIEDQVQLGMGAIVYGGVRIGRCAMVGAGAIVTKDVPPGSTVAGKPPSEPVSDPAVVARQEGPLTGSAETGQGEYDQQRQWPRPTRG